MEKILKYTYLMEVKKIDSELEKLWRKYQAILKKPNWHSLNEARAILYFLGYLYTELIAEKAIERRLHLLGSPLTLIEFYHLVDSHSLKLNMYRKDKSFIKLEQYYNVIKKYKNKHVGGKYYLDEEKFIKLYNKYTPSDDLKIGYMGEFNKE